MLIWRPLRLVSVITERVGFLHASSCTFIAKGDERVAVSESEGLYDIERRTYLTDFSSMLVMCIVWDVVRASAAADKNRRRVTFWAFIECVLILAVAGVQIMRIRNFFEYKRMV